MSLPIILLGLIIISLVLEPNHTTVSTITVTHSCTNTDAQFTVTVAHRIVIMCTPRLGPEHASNTAFFMDNYNLSATWPPYQPHDWREDIKGHPCYDPAKVGGWLGLFSLWAEHGKQAPGDMRHCGMIIRLCVTYCTGNRERAGKVPRGVYLCMCVCALDSGGRGEGGTFYAVCPCSGWVMPCVKAVHAAEQHPNELELEWTCLSAALRTL